jgi:hypothetical protein
MSAERLTHAHPLIGPRKRGRAAFIPNRATDIRNHLDERSRLNRLPGELIAKSRGAGIFRPAGTAKEGEAGIVS